VTDLRQTTGAPGSHILGVGAYEPRRVVDNAELCAWIDSSDEWIRQRTGIVERRWAGEDESLLAMTATAGRRALAHAGMAPTDVDAVLVATVTRLAQFPALAVELAAELGCGPAAAWDVSAACAGFGYALAQADALVRAGTARHVLVVAGDRLTDLTDFHDRATAFLFADGAGAVVVGPWDRPGVGPVVWGSDGSQKDVIRQTLAWDAAVAKGQPPFITMDGQKVFKWALTDVVEVTRRAIEAAGLRPEQIDLFVPHQANDRITDAMLRQLRLPADVVVSRHIRQTGNTSSSSIPIGLARLYHDGLVAPGATCLMVGFGAGLVFAGQVAVLP
jgi:3-oxoacyl-[acyl-carrier-protein] synthase-3